MIKRLERFLGVDLNYIFRGGFWLGLEQAVSILVGLGLSVAFANLIPAETYGVYRYILSFFAILTISTLPNMGVAVTTSVARGLEGLLGQAVKTRIRWGIIGSAAAAVIAAYYFIRGNHQLGVAFSMMVVFLPFVDPFNLYSAYLRGKKFFRVNVQYGIIVRLVSASAVITALVLTKNLYLILLSFFVPYVLLRPLLYFLTIKRHPPNDQPDPRMISYGKHLSVLQLLGVGVDYLDSLLIFHYLGAAPLAVFTIALAPINKMRQAFSVIPELALPKFSESSAQETRRRLMKKVLKAMFLVAVGTALYLVFAPTVFAFLFPKYRESVIYSQFLSLGLLTLPFGLLYTFFQSQAMKRQIYQHKIATMVIQLILTITLVATLGIAGAVVARVSFRFLAPGVLYLLYRRAGS